MKAPVAATEAYEHTEHGVVRADPYHWMEDGEDARVDAYLLAENAYTVAQTAHLEALRKVLYDEMLARYQETDRTASLPRGPFAYYTRTETGKAYTLHCREPRDGGHETLLLDENALAEGHAYFSLGNLAISPDHTLLAYTTDLSGGEVYTLTVVRISDGTVLDTVNGVSSQFVWGNDNASLFWTEKDEALRPFRIRHRQIPGGDPSDDRVLFEDLDPRFYVGIGRTRPGRRLIVQAGHSESTEVWILDGDAPSRPMRCVHPRTDGFVYDVELDADGMYVRTNDGDDPERRAPDYRLYRAAFDTPREDWTLIRDVTPGTSVEDIAVFAGFRVLELRHQGRTRFEVRGLGEPFEVALPETPYVAGLSTTLEFDSPFFHYSFSSLTEPPTHYRYHVADQRSEALRTVPIPTYDPGDYGSVRIYAIARDGTKIPVSLVFKGRELPKDAPCLLYGYGSYGITMEPTFVRNWVSYLDRGMVCAIAHIRGGGYLGRAWYEAAKFAHKARTFDDFEDCAKHLVAEGITRHETLAIMGGSAGGLLMGAVMNRAPGIAKAAVAQVPFVEVISTMFDGELPLTAGEWEEWGDPRDRAIFEAMMGYCPYQNVRQGAYPDIFVTSGRNDPRVQFWGPTKWVARLRAMHPDLHLRLKTHMGAGHQGKSGRYGHLEDSAEVVAWVLDRLGIADG